MAKKKSAATEFNMSEVVREAMGLHPKASAREVQDCRSFAQQLRPFCT